MPVPLREMLKALVKHREVRAAAAPPTDWSNLKIVTASDLMKKPLKPRWKDNIDDAIENPVEASLIASIREEGWRAFAEGGIDAMHKLERAACGDNGKFYNILDKRWDGIGAEGKGRWVA